jgi:hypothetical protein
MEYSSMVSGCVVGTISTAIWLPFSVSKARRRLSNAAFCSGLSVCVRSVTGELSGGTAIGVSCANAVNANSNVSNSSQGKAARGAARRPRVLANATINVFAL